MILRTFCVKFVIHLILMFKQKEINYKGIIIINEQNKYLVSEKNYRKQKNRK